MEPRFKAGETLRAWSRLEVKSFDEATRTFEGIATTPTTDRMGDIVEPKGGQFVLPLPFLKGHDTNMPVGLIMEAKVKSTGIFIKGRVEQVEGPASLKDRLDVMWAEMKLGMIRGLSIGFKPMEWEPIDEKDPWGALRFKVWEWLELSGVVIPANAEATITTIKSFDAQGNVAASGHSRTESKRVALSVRASPGTNPKGNSMNTKEQIASYEAKRAANAAAMEALMKKAADAGESLSGEDGDEFDRLEAEVQVIDKDLNRLRRLEKTLATNATPVPAAVGTDEDSAKKVRHGDAIIVHNKNLPVGIGMARYVKAFAFAKGNYSEAAEYAKQWETSTPEVGLALKTAISAGTTTDSTWAGPLVYAQDFPAAFLEYLRPQTIIGKLTGLSQVPFNIRYGIQDGGSTVAWVGQGAPKPVSKLSFSSGSLGFAKAAGIVIITQELARFSSPSAELKVRDDLTNQMTQFLDVQFIDPGVAAVANVSPASVLNGASNIRQAAAAWTSMTNVLTDVKALLSTFAANEISLAGAYWIMTPDTALSLGLLLNTGGTAFAFPDVNVNGGTFLGLPVIVSNSVPHSVSAGAIVALVVPRHINIADDGQVAIDTSTEASLQMDTAPTVNSATPTATTLVSMFQTNSIAVRVERVINWQRARAYGVGYIDNMHTS